MKRTRNERTQEGCQPLCTRLPGISQKDGGGGEEGEGRGRAWAYYLRNAHGARSLLTLKHSSQVSATRKGSVPVWSGEGSGIWSHTLVTFMLGETCQYSLLPVAGTLPSGKPVQSRNHLVGPQAQARVYMQASGLSQPKLPLPTLVTVF